MLILDTIDADQIELGDQIIVDGEHIEVDIIEDFDDEGIRISGFSWEEGDRITAILPYNYRVDIWAV